MKVTQVETPIKADEREKVEAVPLPKFGPLPDTKKSYNSDGKVMWLPFHF